MLRGIPEVVVEKFRMISYFARTLSFLCLYSSPFSVVKKTVEHYILFDKYFLVNHRRKFRRNTGEVSKNFTMFHQVELTSARNLAGS